MQQLTPQQNANTQKNVQSLLDSRANSVKVPTTKGTFHNTENGWVNTTAGGWTSDSKLENYSVFSVKWGPVHNIFAAAGETAQSVKGKSHLYMYFGPDRLQSRNFGNYSWDGLTNAEMRLNGIHVRHIFMMDLWDNWTIALTPAMFEPNYKMVGAAVDTDGYFTDPKAGSAYYTGWVETPWTGERHEGPVGTEPMYATLWSSVESIQGSTGRSGLVLLLQHGLADILRDSPTMFPRDTKSAYNAAGEPLSQLANSRIWLSYPVSNPVVVFDELPGEQGISQCQAGGLNLLDTRLMSPTLALRERTFTTQSNSMTTEWFVPGFALPNEGVSYADKDGYRYVFCDALKWRGQNVALKCKALSNSETTDIMQNQYEWGQADGDVLFSYMMNIDDSGSPWAYLNSCKVNNDAKPAPELIMVCARVLFDRQMKLHYLQFWNTRDAAGNQTQEPAVPSNATPTSDWFEWGKLTFPPDAALTLLAAVKDSVNGRLDASDTITDSWYALSAGLSKQFLSLDHTTELSGAGQGSTAGGYAKALELYKFNDLEYKKEELDDDDQYLIRHPDGCGGAVLQYGPLSSIYPPVDTKTQFPDYKQNSIDYGELSDDTYLEIYKFGDDERIDVKTALSDVTHTDVLLRQGYLSGGTLVTEVKYLSVDYVVNPLPDAETTNTKLFSLKKNGRDSETKQEQWELYNFHDQDYQCNLSDLTQGCAQFVVRNQWEDMDTTARVRYVPVDQVVAFPDKEGNISKSIERELINDRYELRLYNFLSANEAYSNMSSKPTFKDLAEDGYSILIRDDDDGVGPQLKYFDLRYLSRYGDADIPAFGQSSIETGSSSNALSAPYFQLADFPNPSVVDFNFTINYDGKAYHMTNNLSTAEDVQFVMRNALGGSKDVEYYDFTITAPKVGMTALTEEVINELTSSHCDCGEKWVYISAVIDDISAQVSSLTGDYWESGGDNSTCYGSSIGNSNQIKVIDLDNQTLESNGGYWYVPYLYTSGQAWINQLYVGATYFDAVTGDGHIDGSLDIAGCLEVDGVGTFNSDVLVNSMLQAGCIYANGPIAITGSGGVLQIGNTTLNEAQLIQLLRLL